MTAWHTRPLERVYAAVFIDALHVKIRDGQVGPRPIYAAIGVDLAGHRDVLGMWAGEGDGESAKYWLSVLTELKNRAVADIFFLVCDGLKGLPQSVGAAFPDTVVQTCVIHLIRGTFRYAGRQHRDAIAKAIKPIYTAVNAEAAAAALDAFDAEWGNRYPATIRLWRNAWSEFIPFLDYDTEIRKVICSTNAIESLNARYRRAIRARGHFPNEQAAMKCLYLVTRSLDPTGTGQKRWTMRTKPAHRPSVVAFGLDRSTGEVFERRLTPNHDEILEWVRSLPGPAMVVYEAGPTGFGLAPAQWSADHRPGLSQPERAPAPHPPRGQRRCRNAGRYHPARRRASTRCRSPYRSARTSSTEFLWWPTPVASMPVIASACS